MRVFFEGLLPEADVILLPDDAALLIARCLYAAGLRFVFFGMIGQLL